MLSTILVFGLFLGIIAMSIVAWALFLHLGLKWANITNVTKWRILLTTVVVFVVNILANTLTRGFISFSEASPTQLLVGGLAVTVLIPCLIVKGVFHTRFRLAVKAWLPTLIPTIAMILFASLVFQPFVYETFSNPHNSMAPTLLGDHVRSECPQCGRQNYAIPRDDNDYFAQPRKLICENFHITENAEIEKQVHSPDHFLVAKFLAPRRWDLIVFQYPEDPSTLLVKRLVGLPGETIRIQDGMVWADGQKLTPPDSLRGIHYFIDAPRWELGIGGWGGRGSSRGLGG